MSNDFIMSPKVDFTFKELMQDEQVRMGFLSAVLSIPLESITEATILDASLRKRTEEEKLGILDVRILLNNSTEIDIEIQVYYFKEWKKRSIFYWSKMFSDSLKEGEHYNKLKQCISISILDFTLINDEDDFFSCYQLYEKTRHTIYTDLMKFYVIELPKLRKELKRLSELELPLETGKTDDIYSWARFITSKNKEELEMVTSENKEVYLWARFLASESREEMEMLASESKEINQAYHRLQIISQDQQKKQEYEARQRAIRDTLSLTEQFREEGLEKGLQEGLEKGLQEGLEKGKEVGREEGQNRINTLYLTLKQEGRIDDILRCTEDAIYRNRLLNEYNL